MFSYHLVISDSTTEAGLAIEQYMHWLQIVFAVSGIWQLRYWMIVGGSRWSGVLKSAFGRFVTPWWSRVYHLWNLWNGCRARDWQLHLSFWGTHAFNKVTAAPICQWVCCTPSENLLPPNLTIPALSHPFSTSLYVHTSWMISIDYESKLSYYLLVWTENPGFEKSF